MKELHLHFANSDKGLLFDVIWTQMDATFYVASFWTSDSHLKLMCRNGSFTSIVSTVQMFLIFMTLFSFLHEAILIIPNYVSSENSLIFFLLRDKIFIVEFER